MNKKLTQIKQIENHLLVHGSITTWKAIQTYGITRLAEYIRVLRNRDSEWNIKSVWKSTATKRWTRYDLKNYPNS